MVSTHERELDQPIDLCDRYGNLNPAAVGWSRIPVHRCDLKGHWLRKKQWNYWCITSPTHLFSITLSNISYMGLGFAYFLDFNTQEFIEQTVMTPFGAGFKMPARVEEPVSFHHKNMNVDLLDQTDQIAISVESSKFGNQSLKADFSILRPPGYESLNVVIPWSRYRYQFTSKQECLPASGEVQIGNREIHFDQKDSFACLDFGRGIWKYASSWNWGAFSGRLGDHSIGLNLGGIWTDGTGFTENGILLDGRLIKIGEEIRFEYDPKDFMKPWVLKTKTSSFVDLTFTPFFERVAKTEALILRSEVHQMIGHYSGTIEDEFGGKYLITHVPGWAEEHHARW